MTRQKELPGQETPKIEEIDAAAEAYRDKVRERLDIQREEAGLYEVLAAAMHKHKKEYYLLPGTDYAVSCEKNEKFKVNKIKKPKED